MTRSLKRRRIRPRLIPTLAVILLLPLLVGLGFWQLDRAREKRALISDFATGGEEVSLTGEADVTRLDTLTRYQRVGMQGRFQGDRQFLIDNMTDGGSAGYYVLTPFRMAGASTLILVNRGWVARDFASVSLPDVTVDERLRHVIGRVARLPRPGLEMADRTASNSWPKVVQFPMMDELARHLQQELAPVSVLLDADAEDGYLRRWRPIEFGPDRHIGYAVQWFALALTLMIIYVVVNFRRSKDD